MATTPPITATTATPGGPTDGGIGKRLKNPLGWFASYTYQLSLYIINQKDYDTFVASGRQDISGAKLILQSGGVQDDSKRATGIEHDYYIDNLKIKTIPSTANQSPATTSEITFQIIEPYGFSLISRLKMAADAIKPADPGTSGSSDGPANPTRQFYILGIRFFGYDINGNLLNGSEIFPGEIDKLDPRVTGDSKGVFETYFDILIDTMKFKIDGRATTYNIKATPVATSVAYNNKRGRIDNGAKVVAGEVGEAIRNLLAKLQSTQEDLVKAKKIQEPNRYSVEFRGDGAKFIEKAVIALPDDIEKGRMPTSNAKTTTDSTDAVAVKATPNPNKREVTFKNDTAILQAIDQIITQSSYLRDAMKAMYVSTNQPDAAKKDVKETKPDAKQTASWYSVSPIATNARWDPKTSDFAFDITYVIQMYQTPIVPSSYASVVPPYPGPHKRYEYWYTGQNTEIISYEQTIDNLFYQVVLDPSIGDKFGVPAVPNKSVDESRQGKQDRGAESVNNFRSILYDPGAWNKAKVTIFGDPDFLVQDGSMGSSAGESSYGPDGYTIDPSKGQILIEIDFKEPYDYKNDSGLMSMNGQIQFLPYPNNMPRQPKGVSFLVKELDSFFNNGKFTQVLDCVLSTFSNPDENGANNRESTTSNTTSGPNAQGGTGTTSNNGLAANPPVSNAAKVGQTTPKTAPPPET